jgi:hypothetical protein
VQSGTETDVDCGGICVSGSAGKCALTKICAVNADCGSGNCSAGVCAAPVYDCFNGIQDVNETGVDCGGSDCAAKCLIGVACSLSSDCASGTCTGGVCAKAADTGSCYTGADCNSGVCGGGTATAASSSVNYTTPDGTWTTISGLSTDSAKTASPIAIGFSMNYFGNQYTTFDATSNGWMALGTNGVTSGTTALTLPSFTARNGIALFAQDSGSSAAPVATYRYKLFGTAPYRKLIYDVTGNRTYWSTASVRYTAQAVLYETTGRVDVVCNPCTQETTRAGTQGVTDAAGTVSAFIAGRNNAAFSATDTAIFETLAGRTCQVPTATDGVKNGTETDIDCGGSSGVLCGFNLICSAGSDCKSGECNSGFCGKSTTGEACSANVDCLGANCASNICGVGGGGASCLVNSDCASANCAAGICGKLADGASCSANADCNSELCYSSVPAGVTAVATETVSYPDCAAPAAGQTCYPLTDDGNTSAITLPFPVKFFDTSYTAIRINNNGLASFDSADALGSATYGTVNLSGASTAFPHAALDMAPAVFLYQFDITSTANNSSSGVATYTTGTSPNQKFYVTFKARTGSAGSLTGAMIFSEADGSVTLQCDTCSSSSGAKTRGVRNADGSRGMWYYDNTSLGTEAATSFSVTASLNAARRALKYQTNTNLGMVCAVTGSSGTACSANASCTSGACVAAGASSVAYVAPANLRGGSAFNTGALVTSSSTSDLRLSGSNASIPVPIGFPFTFFGTSYSALRAASAGYLYFSTTNTSNASAPPAAFAASSSAPNGVIAYFWHPMGAQTATTAGNFRTVGSAPDRTFIFAVNGAVTGSTGGATSAEVKLYEKSNLIDITCVACTQATTAVPTALGLENPAGTTVINALGSGTTTSAVNTTTYRFNTGSSSVCF